MKWFALALVLISFKALSFLPNKTVLGENIKWSTTKINLYLDNESNQSFSSSSISSIVEESVNQWNTQASAELFLYQESRSGLVSDQNNIVFDSDSSFFSGSSVIAYTLISYDDSSGKIDEADIILNDNYVFSNTKSEKSYLGNVISHEIGHLLGLSHGQVKASTMLHVNAIGQYELHEDDIIGYKSIYEKNQEFNGVIKGTIVGGIDDIIGIFAAHVQAISMKDGKVKSATYSDESGYFEIRNLDTEDNYYLYIEPITDKIELGLSSYYNTSRKNYCSGGSSYRGAFYSSCQRSQKGQPQGISFNSSTAVALGNVTIRCGVDTSEDYNNQRDTTYTWDLTEGGNYYENGFVGYFTQSEITSNTAQYIDIDLTQVEGLSSGSFLVVNLGLHKFNQTYALDIEYGLNSSLSNFDSKTNIARDEDYTPIVDQTIVVGLSSIDSTQNIVSLKLTPSSLEDYLLSYSLEDMQVDDLFPGLDVYGDNLGIYFLNAYIATYNSETNEYEPVSKREYFTIMDNSSCVDGPKSFSVNVDASGLVENSGNSSNRGATKEASVFSCASLSIDNGNKPKGPTNLVGFSFGFLIMLFVSRKRNMVNAPQ